MVTTKATHLGAVLDDLIDYHTPVVFWQNGIGINYLTQQRLPDTSIIRALIWAGVNYESPGVVKCNGFSRIALAKLQGDIDPRMLADCLNKAGLRTLIVDNADLAEWEKSLWNIGVNALCAITRERNGTTIDSPHLRELLVHLLREAQHVARAAGCDLDMEESVIQMIRTTAANINSMVRDIEIGRLTEIEYLNGYVIQLGSHLGIETPYNTFAYHLVKHFEDKRCVRSLDQSTN
jgi:2-dehydropantoate 2-reductase